MARPRPVRRKGEGVISRPLLQPSVRNAASFIKRLNDSSDPPKGLEKLTALLGRDCRPIARLLYVVNIATGRKRSLTDLNEAVDEMGWANLRALALGVAMFSAAQRHDRNGRIAPDGSLTLRQLWDHAMGCAMLGGAIGAAVDYQARYRYFVAGFLHDIGKTLLFQDSEEALTVSINLARETDIPSTEAEMLVLGRDHIELGISWSRAFELDPMLQCAILQHHQSRGILSGLPAEQLRLAAAIQLADRLCESFAVGAGGDSGEILPGLCEMIGVREAYCLEQLGSIRVKMQRTGGAFGSKVMARDVLPHAKAMHKRKMMIENSEPGARNPGLGGRRARVIPFPRRPRSAPEGGDKATDKKLTLLVVEDHGSLCDMLSLYFMRYGYHVRTANDGESALEIMNNEEIHLVLLDLMLPRMDGFSVLRQIRKREGDRPPYVIVVSAGASTKDRNLVLELGANEYMPKPFHLVRLLERVQNVEKYLLN